MERIHVFGTESFRRDVMLKVTPENPEYFLQLITNVNTVLSCHEVGQWSSFLPQ